MVLHSAQALMVTEVMVERSSRARKIGEQADKIEAYRFGEIIYLTFAVRMYLLKREIDRYLNRFGELRTWTLVYSRTLQAGLNNQTFQAHLRYLN